MCLGKNDECMVCECGLELGGQAHVNEGGVMSVQCIWVGDVCDGNQMPHVGSV